MSASPIGVDKIKLLSDQYLDELALAALVARWERVERSQIGKLLEYLEATDEFTLMVYLVRQVARGAWSSSKPSLSAPRLFKVLRDITQQFNDEALRRNAVRKALGYFKWFYESWDLNIGAIRNLSRKYNRIIRNPREQAPTDFARECLEALLGL